jgi:putative redox protein
MVDDWQDLKVEWVEGMTFRGMNPEGGEILIGGTGEQATLSPMELLLAGVAGCTGVDIVHIMKKKKQIPESFEIQVRAKRAPEHPKVYTDIEIHYLLEGKIKEKDLQQAIELSRTKYCSASAMLGEAAHISYSYEIR